MSRLAGIVIVGAVAGLPVGVMAKTEIPDNVTVRDNRIIEKIDWSFTPPGTVDFAKLKRCVAINLQNDEIQLKDSAGSWVGPATGNYYQRDNRSTIEGRDIFKIVDDQSKFLVAQGWIDKQVLAFKWIIRFDLELGLEGGTVKMVMRNIKLAMSNTGSGTNNGFFDLSTSYRFKQNYETIKEKGEIIKSCIME